MLMMQNLFTPLWVACDGC